MALKFDSIQLERQIDKLWEDPLDGAEEVAMDAGVTSKGEKRPDIRAFYIKYEDLAMGIKVDKGSYGAVWKGTYEGTEVALKEITALNDEEDIFYIDREVSALVRVCHPNIVNFVGVCKHKSRLYIVTEWVQCGNLRNWLENTSFAFPWALRIQVAIDTVEAMVYMHGRNMVHRDIKAKNLLITEDWHVKLCDFGFARVQDRSGRPMTICGTHAYMAPEISAGGVYSERADVYSFGVCLAEMICRRAPDDGLVKKGTPGGLDNALFDRLAPRDCPPGLFKLAVVCCNLDPAQRPSFPHILSELKTESERLELWSLGEMKVSDLTLGDVVGQGSFGKVYKGEYRGTPVAIKVLSRRDNDDVQLMRFEREKAALMAIRSPNIVQIVGSCYDDENLYLVTEYIAGGTVKELLASNPTLPWPERINIALDVVRAMVYLHSKGQIHRDLKSSNLLMDTTQGRVKVCDFGMSRPVTRRHMTKCGTPAYMAPEIQSGQQYGKLADVYSFGVIVGELVTGRPPTDWITLPASPPKSSAVDSQGTQGGGAVDGAALRKYCQSGCPPPFFEVAVRCTQEDPSLRGDFFITLDRLVQLSQLNPTKDGFVTAHQIRNLQRPLSQKFLYSFSAAPSTSGSSATSLSASGVVKALDGLMSDASSGSSAAADGQMLQMHLDKIVRRATNPEFSDTHFLRDFLLTFNAFTRPSDLLEALTKRWTTAGTAEASSSPISDEKAKKEAADGVEKKKLITRLRVVNALKQWATLHFEDFQGIITNVIDFVQDYVVVEPATEKLAMRLLNMMDDKRKQEFVPAFRAQPPKLSVSLTDAVTHVGFLSVHPTELARQITAMDSEVLNLMGPRELISVISMNQSQVTAPNVFHLDRRFEEIANWITREVVSVPELKQRSASLARIIEMAEQLRVLKNFGSVFAVMAGLAHPAVQRLVQTWKDLSRASQRRLAKLKALVSADEDYADYRTALAKASPPRLPHMDIVIRDLETLNGSAPTQLRGMVNVNKMRNISELIYSTLSAAKGNYDAVDDDFLRRFVLTKLSEEGQDFMRLSIMCE